MTREPPPTSLPSWPCPDLDEVTTLLCDADGNLFPSEEIAFEASTEVTNRCLAEVGMNRRFEASGLRRAALGRNFRSTLVTLLDRDSLTVSESRLAAWESMEAEQVTALLRQRLGPQDEVRRVLERLASRFKLALVSSSALRRLNACLEVSGLEGVFPPHLRFSASDSLGTPTSKPDPAVYRHALQQLEIQPTQAIAVEDASSGVRSAVSAGITSIGNVTFAPEEEREQQRSELLAAGAATVVESWEQLHGLLCFRSPERYRQDRYEGTAHVG